jgi:hypothetical protein
MTMVSPDDGLAPLDIVEKLRQAGLDLGGLDLAHCGLLNKLVNMTGQNIGFGCRESRCMAIKESHK